MARLANIFRPGGIFEPVFEDRMLDDLLDGLLQLPMCLLASEGVPSLRGPWLPRLLHLSITQHDRMNLSHEVS